MGPPSTGAARAHRRAPGGRSAAPRLPATALRSAFAPIPALLAPLCVVGGVSFTGHVDLVKPRCDKASIKGRAAAVQPGALACVPGRAPAGTVPIDGRELLP